jgi:signal peptidase II
MGAGTSAEPSDSQAPRRLLRRALLLAALVAVLDQASKGLILAVVMQPPRVIEITGFFNLVLTYNTGVSFGLLSGDLAWKPWLLAALAVAVSVGLFLWLRRRPEPLLAWGVGLVAGGALGNALDRLHRPGVVDFLDLHAAGWHWPAFNLADSGITVGVALLILDGLFGGGQESRK